MKTALKYMGFLFVVLAVYLLLFPVAISPKAWEAPLDKGYVGDFAPNTDLAALTEVPLPDGIYGPEDIVEMNGEIYVSSQNGKIFRFDAQSNTFTVFAETGGKPLGMEVLVNGQGESRLIVADPYLGLVSVNQAGDVSVLTDTVDGTDILYADDLDISDDGLIYFSDASTKFGAKAAGSTLAASLLEIMEHGETGRVLVYNPKDKTTKTLAEGLSFSNGVATAPDGKSVWVVETGKYRLLEIAPDGSQKVILDNLPGFPDNINRGPDGTYFVGLVSKRAEALDTLSETLFLRKVIWRLPGFMKPAAQDYGFVLQLNSVGEVVRTWQDPSGAYPATTGAVVIGDRLYVSSLTSKTLGYRPYP